MEMEVKLEMKKMEGQSRRLAEDQQSLSRITLI
jgi:hypothetical protein